MKSNKNLAGRSGELSREFGSCEICGHEEWSVSYEGPVRDGSFGNLTAEDRIVACCQRCGVERLEEAACKDTGFYEGEEYRRLLNEPLDAAGFMAGHDRLQMQPLAALWPKAVRNKTVADVGCGAGSFLDHISGLAARCVAVEPCEAYHESLRSRGYSVFPFPTDASREIAGEVDLAFSLSVIEHVADPRTFLEEISELLAPDGKLMISTPNRADVLMDLLPEDYRRFFYRTVHRWYFDADSLAACAGAAGLEVVETKCAHRFGLSNVMAWLRDRKPTGSTPLPGMDDPAIDSFWKTFLESKGIGDYLYTFLRRRS